MSLNHDGTTSAATRLGFEAGQIIQEYYFDDDADMALRAQLEEALGNQLVDEDYADVVDGAIAWWREEDGGVDELTDLLVDVAANLDGEGLIWVFTPRLAVLAQFHRSWWKRRQAMRVCTLPAHGK